MSIPGTAQCVSSSIVMIQSNFDYFCTICSWFSLQYGKDLASLRAPVRKAKTQPFEKSLREAESQAKSTKDDISKSQVGSKYRWRREVAHADAQEKLRLLQLLETKWNSSS